MTAEKAAYWSEGEHSQEKKEVLAKLDSKLDQQQSAKELPELIADLSVFRYPADPNAEQKKSAFDRALGEVSAYCASSGELSKYEIKKEDILKWCSISLLEDGHQNVWEKMARKSSFQLNRDRQAPSGERAENIFALRLAMSQLGLSGDLMPHCELSVKKREPNSFTDRLFGLPAPSADAAGQSQLAFLNFELNGAKIQLRFDTSSPRNVYLDGLVPIKDSNRVVAVSGLATLGGSGKIESFTGRETPMLSAGSNLNNFLKLVLLAGN